MKYLTILIVLLTLSGCTNSVDIARIHYTCKDHGGPLIPNPKFLREKVTCNDGSHLKVKQVIHDPKYWNKSRRFTTKTTGKD